MLIRTWPYLQFVSSKGENKYPKKGTTIEECTKLFNSRREFSEIIKRSATAGRPGCEEP